MKTVADRTRSETSPAKPSPFSRRELGILLHPTSLYNHEDVGTVGKYAYRFVDFLAQAGASLWQILPLTPNGQYNSPYFSYSAFAGNRWLVDLELLRDNALLEHPPLRDSLHDHKIPFTDLPRTKLPQLLRAAETFLSQQRHPWRESFLAFCRAEAWLDYTAHFFALKEQYQDTPWWRWDAPVRRRDPAAVKASQGALAKRMELWKAIFYFFDRQWSELKTYANEKGIRILGDLPIYVNHDSADVWVYQDQFKLDQAGRMVVQSGVPPDYFSETGQLWANPIYDWRRMAEDGFAWWVARLKRCVALNDIVRIDHFRALSAYWEIPGDAADARKGQWRPGPGQKFFTVLRKHFPQMPFVAEDLGTLDDAVHRLRDDNGLYGMRILQFGFDGMPDNLHRPDVFPTTCIAYTGTHDNDTVAGWWGQLGEEARREVAAYYQFSPDAPLGTIVWSLIEACIASRANVAVVPMQDLLVLDQRARMNDPASFVANWEWRLPPDGTSDELATSIRRLRDRYRP